MFFDVESEGQQHCAVQEWSSSKQSHLSMLACKANPRRINQIPTDKKELVNELVKPNPQSQSPSFYKAKWTGKRTGKNLISGGKLDKFDW